MSKTKPTNMSRMAPARDEIAIPQKIERPHSPYVITRMRQKSFLGEKAQAAIRQLMEKVNNVEKEQQLAAKNHAAALEAKVNRMAGDIYSYQMQAGALETELDNLLKINDMYQDTIKSLEDVIQNKDKIIQDHLHTIAKLTEGNAQELKDIKLMFFSKQKDLVD